MTPPHQEGVPQTSSACLGEERLLATNTAYFIHWRAVPRNLKRYYGAGDLHFVTFSCHRRLGLLGSARRRDLFLGALEATRLKYEMLVVGYVVMSEHVHLLIGEPGRQNLSTAIKALKQSVSRRVLRRPQGPAQFRLSPFRRPFLPQRVFAPESSSSIFSPP